MDEERITATSAGFNEEKSEIGLRPQTLRGLYRSENSDRQSQNIYRGSQA